jgi:Rad3-related DNA helicase
VAIVSVGLPGLSFHRDLMVNYFDEQARHGFQFAYGYPAMNKVLQALGRVIRSEEDRGVALLLDARYLHPDYQSIFQRYPIYDVILSPDECFDAVHAFFAQDKQ